MSLSILEQNSASDIRTLTLVLSLTSVIIPVSSVFEFLFPNKVNSSLAPSIKLKRQDNDIISITNPSGESQSGREYGDACDAINPCSFSKFLECIDGKCMCQNPLHRAFDEDLKECVNLVGSLCGGNGPKCVRNSQCVFGACQCLQNFSQTSTKVCLLGRGKACQPSECNGEKNLACIQNTCKCIDSLMVYEPFSGRCLDPQQEFGDFARNVGKAVAQRVVVGKISGTVLGAKSLARGIVFLPVRLLVPGIG